MNIFIDISNDGLQISKLKFLFDSDVKIFMESFDVEKLLTKITIMIWERVEKGLKECCEKIKFFTELMRNEKGTEKIVLNYGVKFPARIK